MSNTDDLRTMVRALARLARSLERSTGELSLPQYRVLSAIDAGDQRATRLANRLSLAKPTITAMVESLVDRGFIRREEVAGDRRAVALAITPDGRKALAEAEESMFERLSPHLDRLSDDERATVTAAFESLTRSLDEALVERPAART